MRIGLRECSGCLGHCFVSVHYDQRTPKAFNWGLTVSESESIIIILIPHSEDMVALEQLLIVTVSATGRERERQTDREKDRERQRERQR